MKTITPSAPKPTEDRKAPQKTATVVSSDAFAPMDATGLRSVLLAGLRTNQFDISQGQPVLKEDASGIFLGRLASAVRESIVLTPGITPAALNRSRIFKENSGPAFAAVLEEIRVATLAIDQKYAGFAGSLGSPVTGVEFGGKDLTIPYRKYEGGAIYVMPNGTFEVHGSIYVKYVELGAETGFLGFPTTDEQGTTLGAGRFNHFQHGSIYWTLPTGAWSIRGPIRDRWFQVDAERGEFGFPVSDVEPWGTNGGDLVSHFQNGKIVFQGGQLREQVTPQAVHFSSSVSVSSVNCQFEFSMNNAGDWHFKGHMHNSGFLGFNVAVATAPMFQDAAGNVFARTIERHVTGTTFSPERDDDWEEFGKGEPFIRDNWEFLRHAGLRTVMDVNTTVGALIDVLFVSIPVAIGVVIGGLLATGHHICPGRGYNRRDPVDGLDKPDYTFSIKPEGEPCDNTNL
jgi:hypothetical protein